MWVITYSVLLMNIGAIISPMRILVLYLFKKYPTPCRWCFVILMLLLSLYSLRCVIIFVRFLIFCHLLSIAVACLLVVAQHVFCTSFALLSLLEILRCLEIVLIDFFWSLVSHAPVMFSPVSSDLLFFILLLYLLLQAVNLHFLLFLSIFLAL